MMLSLINAGLGEAIAPVPTIKVVDAFNSVAKVVGNSAVPNYLYSVVNPSDLQAVCNAFLEFEHVMVVFSVFWLPSCLNISRVRLPSRP